MNTTNDSIPGPTDFDTFQTLFNYYRDPLQTFENLKNIYGDIFQIKFWKYHVIHLSHPDDIRAVLQDPNFEISTVFTPAEPLIGKGLATNTGDDWVRQRQRVRPAFHEESVAQYVEGIRGTTQAMLSRWEAYAQRQEVFDLVKELVALNHAQLVQLLFQKPLAPENDSLLEALKFARHYTYQRAISLITPPSSWVTPTTRRFDQVVQVLNQFTYDLIQKSRATSHAPKDVLSHLIQVRDHRGEGMTDQQIHDELLTMFFSAYEDVANVLAWAFYLLAQNPKIAQAVQAEVAHLTPETLTLETLQHLPTVSNVIAETLRLYPPTWSSLRVAQADTQLRGYPIPKGSITLLNVFLLHRHPDYWPDPTRFDPGRFAGVRGTGAENPAYLPFGSQPRDCIGDSLALAQLKINLALILQKFRVTPKTGIKVGMETDATLRMRGGLSVRVTEASE